MVSIEVGLTMHGKTLAHYKILEKIGAGGMGDVYRANDSKLGRDVALKVLPEEMAGDPERRRRFEREAKAIAALKHPNIVTIYSVEEADGSHFITMELVEGNRLADVIPQEGLSLDRFFEIAIPLADAIGSAHEQNITHRDLKPANVMLDKDGRVKVLDFGLAKLLEASPDMDSAKTVVRSSDTAVGQILGTAAYMSPEQAEGKPVDHRSDIFSLGIVLYEMATGDRPFKGETHISTISSILKDTPPTVSELRSALPRHLGRIVDRCLEKNADKRFQSAKDIRNELEGLQKEVESDQLSATGMIKSSRAMEAARGAKAGRRWVPRAAGVTAVIVLITAVIWTFSSRTDESTRATQTTRSEDTGTSNAQTALTDSRAPDERKMTVVLPFENLGPAEEAYFAAGVTEEITSRLATVSGMGVISRTSAVQYDRTGKNMKQIGEDLGVDYVLEGSVRWGRNPDGTGRVRITPQLIQVSDDTHLWSDTYDRDIVDIFEVQTDIANQVIEQLGVTLLGSERERIQEKPTQNIEAYQLYLQARDLAVGLTAEYDRRKVELLERATELDPRFVAPLYELCLHHSNWYRILERTETRLARAREVLQKAEAVDREHHLTRLARGYYYYYGFRDYDRALEEFVAASRSVPNDSEARRSIGYIQRRKGNWQECIDDLQAAFELDPQSKEVAVNLAATYLGMREYEEAIRYLDRAFSLDPDDYESVSNKAFAYICWKGDLEAAREIMKEKPKANPTSYYYMLYLVHTMERDFAGAIETARKLEETTGFVRALRQFMIAIAETGQKGPKAAIGTLETTAGLCEDILRTAPSNGIVRQWLAITYALLGRENEAIREAKLAVDLTAKDAFAGPSALENLALVYAHTNRHDEAIDLIERLLSTVYRSAITVHLLRLHPGWDPLREHPRFQSLLQTKHL